MKLLKGGLCSKALVLVLVIIAVGSLPDQCEAVKCYKSTCIDKCDNSQATEVECTQDPPCYYGKFLVQGQTQITRNCNTVGNDKCMSDKFQFGVGLGCKEATGKMLKECYPDSYQDEDHVKWCTCSGDLCNAEDITAPDNGGNGGSGGGSGSGGRSLKWTATGAGLMMISIL